MSDAFRAGKIGKRDSNEKSIVEALEAIGVKVWRLDWPVDLLLMWRGKVYVAEIKMPDGDFEPGQKTFIREAGYAGCKVHVWRSVEEALAEFGARRAA